MQVVLHGHYFHLIIVSLVVLDAIIVLFELLLDVGAFSKHYTKLCVIMVITLQTTSSVKVKNY